MKLLSCFSLLSRPVIALALLIIPAASWAQPVVMTFDASQLGNPDYDPSNIYVTFLGQTSNMTIGGDSINFTSASLPGGNSTSASYSLANITANGGVILNSATSMTAYISFGSNTTGFGNLTGGANPNYVDSNLPRYSVVEFSYNEGGDHTGGADLTNIVQFGSSLKLASYSGNVISNATLQSYVQNTATAGDMLRNLAAAAGNSSIAVFTTGSGASETYTRVIGPSKMTSNSPYAPFNNYFAHLSSTYGNSSVATLQNLMPGQPAGGSGSIGGFTYNGTTDNYNANYNFNATVTPTGGNYTVTLTGNIVMTPAVVGAGTTKTYENLTITIPADSAGNLNMTNFLYLEPAPSGTPVTINFSSGWGNTSPGELEYDFGNLTNLGYDAQYQLSQKVYDDFAQGMLMGLVGSNVSFNGTSATNVTVNGTIGSFSSVEWWQFPELPYLFAQPENQFYGLYGQLVWDNSGGFNTTLFPNETFNGTAVYGNPYDDRFGQNLLNLDADTTNMVVSLLPDGNLHVIVPEPGTYALLASGAALAAATAFRRRKVRDRSAPIG